MARVSVLIPSRNEIFLCKTVQGLLAKAEGDVEILVCLEGYWDHGLPADKRVKILHHGEPKGMRQAINSMVQMSTGNYLMKADAHTIWDEGWDRKLASDYLEDNWILVPRRQPLDPDNWKIQERTDHKYPIDYHFLSEPFDRHGDAVPGLHGSDWRERREQRKHIELDEELASQGSAWFMSRDHWNRVGPLDQSKFGQFWYESQELSLRTWMMGGAQMVTKRTWYGHWFKGKRGRGYNTRNMGHENATLYNSWFWCTDVPFQGRVRTMKWLLEKFAPIPTWHDIDAILARARRECLNPYQMAA